MAPPRIRHISILLTSIPPLLLLLLLLLLLTLSINTHAVYALTPLTSLPSLDPSTAFPPLLRKRQTSCTTSGSSRCASPASHFCCPSTTECIPLNNATSVICCPTGQDCSFIQPITCSSSLSTCGTNGQCCPAGYDCDAASGGCRLQDHNKPASYKLRDECAKLNLKNGSGGTSQTCMALIEATKKSCLNACEQFPVQAIVAGFFPGLAAGAAVMFLVGLWMRRREMRALGAARNRGRGAGGAGAGGGGGRRSGGDGGNRSSGRHKNAPGGYKDPTGVYVLSAPGGGFAAARASKRAQVPISSMTGAHGGGGGYSASRDSNLRSPQRTRSAGAATVMSSTEIAIGYDRRQDEQFSPVSGGGRGTPASGYIVTSPTPPPFTPPTPLTRSPSGAGGRAVGGAARGYNSDLRSPRHFIPEELSGSMHNIELSAMGPSIKSPSGTTRGAAAASRGPAASPPPPIPPPRNRAGPSPVASPSSGGKSISFAPLTASTARKPLPAPLTHEHLLQHQQQHQQQQLSPISGPIAPRAQSEYRSEDTSSFAPTSLSHSDNGSSAGDAVGAGVGGSKRPKASADQHLATDTLGLSTTHRHRRKKSKRPPSDVTSCITDGDHNDGLTTISELATAGVLPGVHHGGVSDAGGHGMGAVRVSQAGTKCTSVADKESVAAGGGLPLVGEGAGGGEERVAVDWGVPPPLPEGYEYEYSEESGRRVVTKSL